MTKLRWDKAGEREPDPARIIEVSDTGGVWCGNDSHPFETEQQRRRRQAAEREALLKRSDEIRFKAMIKKYGKVRAIILGVPTSFIRAQEVAKLRAQEKQRRASEKKERRAARKAAGLSNT